MSDYYIPKDGKMVPTTLEKWARWFGKADRHIGKTHIGDIYVSTVVLGLDHSGGFGPPQLFETMVFGGESAGEEIDGYTERYATWAQAEAGHAATVARIEAAVGDADKLLQGALSQAHGSHPKEP